MRTQFAADEEGVVRLGAMIPRRHYDAMVRISKLRNVSLAQVVRDILAEFLEEESEDE